MTRYLVIVTAPDGRTLYVKQGRHTKDGIFYTAELRNARRFPSLETATTFRDRATLDTPRIEEECKS